MKNPYEYKKGKYIDIVLSGEPTRLHPGNAHIFTHNLQSEGDHIYVIHRDMGDEMLEASYMWRINFREAKRDDKYTDLAHRLGRIGCETHEAAFMSDHDSERFYSMFGRLALIDIKEFELTQRHEQEIGRLGVNLDKMPPKDIMAEMKLPNDFRPYPPLWASR